MGSMVSIHLCPRPGWGHLYEIDGKWPMTAGRTHSQERGQVVTTAIQRRGKQAVEGDCRSYHEGMTREVTQKTRLVSGRNWEPCQG